MMNKKVVSSTLSKSKISSIINVVRIEKKKDTIREVAYKQHKNENFNVLDRIKNK